MKNKSVLRLKKQAKFVENSNSNINVVYDFKTSVFVFAVLFRGVM